MALFIDIVSFSEGFAIPVDWEETLPEGSNRDLLYWIMNACLQTHYNGWKQFGSACLLRWTRTFNIWPFLPWMLVSEFSAAWPVIEGSSAHGVNVSEDWFIVMGYACPSPSVTAAPLSWATYEAVFDLQRGRLFFEAKILSAMVKNVFVPLCYHATLTGCRSYV